MNTIKFHFEDLCAFFSRYESRLMVGLISTEGEAPENVHEPRITIKRNGVVEREYQTFDEINGDIILEVLPEGKPLSRYTPQSAGDPRRPFSKLVDIENDLHPQEQLNVDPGLCIARLYFRNGEIFTTDPLTNARFVDIKTGQFCENAPTELSANAGIEVEIPKDGYARLRFLNGTEDFIFQSGSDYEVEVINHAEANTGEHFRFFYNVINPKPEHMWYIASTERLGLPVPGAGNFGCWQQTFGKTEWEWPVGDGADSEVS
jgi:hypothetical protein